MERAAIRDELTRGVNFPERLKSLVSERGGRNPAATLFAGVVHTSSPSSSTATTITRLPPRENRVVAVPRHGRQQARQRSIDSKNFNQPPCERRRTAIVPCAILSQGAPRQAILQFVLIFKLRRRHPFGRRSPSDLCGRGSPRLGNRSSRPVPDKLPTDRGARTPPTRFSRAISPILATRVRDVPPRVTSWRCLKTDKTHTWRLQVQCHE